MPNMPEGIYIYLIGARLSLLTPCDGLDVYDVQQLYVPDITGTAWA